MPDRGIGSLEVSGFAFLRLRKCKKRKKPAKASEKPTCTLDDSYGRSGGSVASLIIDREDQIGGSRGSVGP